MMRMTVSDLPNRHGVSGPRGRVASLDYGPKTGLLMNRRVIPQYNNECCVIAQKDAQCMAACLKPSHLSLT